MRVSFFLARGFPFDFESSPIRSIFLHHNHIPMEVQFGTKFHLEIRETKLSVTINFKFGNIYWSEKKKKAKKETDKDPPATSTKVQKVKRFLPVKFVAMFSFKGGCAIVDGNIILDRGPWHMGTWGTSYLHITHAWRFSTWSVYLHLIYAFNKYPLKWKSHTVDRVGLKFFQRFKRSPGKFSDAKLYPDPS